MSPRQAASGGLAGIPPVDQTRRVLRPADAHSLRLPPYNTHPRMRSSLGRAQPRRVVEATGPVENLEILAPRGEPLAKFRSAALERPNPPHTIRSTGGGAGTWIGAPTDSLRAKKNSGYGSRGGTPGKILVAGVGKASPPPRTPPGIGGAAGRRLWGPAGLLRAQ